MPTKEEILKKCRLVEDPHTGINIVDMGLIEDIEIKKDEVKIKFKPTSPYCPMVGVMKEGIMKNVSKIAKTVSVEVVF